MIGVVTMNGKQISWNDAPDLLRVSEAADLMRVTVQTIRDWTDKDKLSSHKTVGGHRRIKKADLRALWESRQTVSEADRLRLALREILLTDDVVTAHRVANEALGEDE